MEIKIIVAAHKPYRMPHDSSYLPLHVGCEGKDPIGFTGDNTGDHISEKNPTFCELTGLYWAYKNLDTDYLGLAHYRRHFASKKKSSGKKGDPFDLVVSGKELRKIFMTSDIILPKKRNYIVETLESHYCHTHYPEPLKETRRILKELYPDMTEAFDQVMKRRSGHMFNMFIMKKEKADEYCEFLFPVLFELEKRIDISGYDAFQARVFGRISELLMDVWITYHDYSYEELPFIYMEDMNLVGKGMKFLKSWLFHKMY